ncbi:MAG: CHAT domain-containing protein [Bacteroidetes bacterium]|nr:CHAT domain-containing protein [Bacteroidota bacterium]
MNKVFLHFVIFILFATSSIAQDWKYHDSLTTFFQEKRQYTEALQNAEKSIELYQIEVGQKDTVYTDLIQKLAYVYYFSNNYDKAIETFNEELELRVRLQGREHQKTGTCLNNISILHRRKGDYENALKLSIEALEITGKSMGENHIEYGVRLNNLAIIYEELGNYEKALELQLTSIENVKNNNLQDQHIYGTRLNNLASLYYKMGLYEKALELYIESIENTEKTLGKKHPTYGVRLNNLAALYKKMGMYDKALILYEESLQIAEVTVGKSHQNYFVRINNLATLLEEMGQFDKAHPLYLYALENAKLTFGTEHPTYVLCLNNLAEFYRNTSQNENALPLLIDAVESSEKVFGKSHPNYASSLNNLANLYRNLGQYDKALSMQLEALDVTEKALGKNHHAYSIRLNNLANIYRYTGNYESALSLYLESIKISENSLGKDHSGYGMRAYNIGEILYYLDRKDESYEYYKIAIVNNFLNIDRAFTFLAEADKEKFLLINNRYFNSYFSFFYEYSLDNNKVGADAFNIDLAAKGMILQSGIEIRQTILNSGNQEAIEKYDEWVEVKSNLSKEYSTPIEQRVEDIDILEQKAEKLESELTRLSGSFGRVKSLTNVKWQDVQSKLKNDEVAIQFSSFAYFRGNFWTDSVIYIAVILRKDFEYPLLIPLFEQKQLISILGDFQGSSYDYINDAYGTLNVKTNKTTDLYNLIWQPLEKYLNGINNVYISPTGMLHKISFYALRNNENRFLNDLYSINIQSNLGNIAQSNKADKFNIKSASIFGGVEYSKIPSESDAWKYLPGTLTELHKIKAMLKKTKVKTVVFSGEYATEENLKSIASNTELLHIATHGYFFPDPTDMALKMKDIKIEGEVDFRGSSSNIATTSFKDNPKPLMRSGLLLAGANNSWSSNESTDNTDDGVLTAEEVAYLNLFNTKLVVLSACETGLGDIKGSEGVYGLQRAFKMAGAKTIIMSLWQVPDKETVEFMELFYAKLLKHKDVKKAFFETQSFMRNKYDPFFWAAFVLLE